MTSRIFIIEDEPIMAECLARSVRRAVGSSRRNKTPDEPNTPDKPKTLAKSSPNQPDAADLEILTFSNAISAMSALSDGLPDLILLDVLLDGPNGFTFLNELISYPDTAQIPVVIVSSLDLSARDLSPYGVVSILHKDTMTPPEITIAVRRTLAIKEAPVASVTTKGTTAPAPFSAAETIAASLSGASHA